MTPECKQSLLEYKQYRENKGTYITSSSPLIESDLNPGQPMTISGYHQRWYRILRRADLDQKSVKYYELHLHTLRKYFRSRCIGVDPSFREKWMGHKGGYLDESYFRVEEQRHLMEYRRAIQHLSIFPVKLEEKGRRKQALLDFARFQGWSEEKLIQLQTTLQNATTVDEAAKTFRNLSKNQKIDAKIVHSDTLLIDHIKQGWELMNKLEENKYLIRKIK
jgi:allantoicase